MGPPFETFRKELWRFEPMIRRFIEDSRMTIKSLILHNCVMFLQFFLSFSCFFDHFGFSWFLSLLRFLWEPVIFFILPFSWNLVFFFFFSFFLFFRELLLRRALCRKGRERKETKGKEGRKERRKQRKERKVSKKSDMEKKRPKHGKQNKKQLQKRIDRQRSNKWRNWQIKL